MLAMTHKAIVSLPLCPLPPLFPAASSTTGPDHLKQDKDTSANDASSWSVDDVIRFVQEADPQTLGPHIDLFRKHVGIIGRKDAKISCPMELGWYFSGKCSIDVEL